MELPRSALNIQRGLALLILAAVLSVAIVERRSPFASRLRANKPWPFWLSVHAPDHAATLHLGIYNPVRRILVLILIPATTKLRGTLASAQTIEDLAQIKISALCPEPIEWEGVGHLTLELEAAEENGEPAVAAARALKARGRSPRALWALARRALTGLARGDRSAADALLLTRELRRTPLEDLEPALLPDDPAAPGFLARAFASQIEPRRDEKAIVVEVLNGTDRQGLATQAAKVLRSRGVDVMALGRAPHPRSRTVVYDRTGDFDRAARVRVALGCPTAITTTRIDALRGVDASVELGGDCRF